MSVASALTDIANSLSALLSQINTKLSLKGVSTGASDMAEVPDKINAIVTGSGIDTSDATASAGDIRSGKTAYVDGAKLTGTLSITSRSSSDVTVSGKTVTVPAGNYSSQVQKSVSTATQATPSISVNTSTGVITASATQSAGYVSSGTKSATYSLTTKSAQTYTPGPTSQTISSGTFLTGTQTIQGDSDLQASNIKSGVSIFGVLGTYGGSGGADSLRFVSSKSFERVGAGALNFNGFTAPAGGTLIGALAYKTSDDYDAKLIDCLIVINTGSGNINAVKKGNNRTLVSGYTTSEVSLTVNDNTSGTIYVDSSIIFFAEGYEVMPIYSV